MSSLCACVSGSVPLFGEKDGSKCFHLEEEIGTPLIFNVEASNREGYLDLYALFNACP